MVGRSRKPCRRRVRVKSSTLAVKFLIFLFVYKRVVKTVWKLNCEEPCLYSCKHDKTIKTIIACKKRGTQTDENQYEHEFCFLNKELEEKETWDYNRRYYMENEIYILIDREG